MRIGWMPWGGAFRNSSRSRRGTLCSSLFPEASQSSAHFFSSASQCSVDKAANDKGHCRSHPIFCRNAVLSLSPALGGWASGVSRRTRK
jgi:hypothetical protein